MNAMETAQRYFEAYSDPTGGQGLHGEPLVSYAKGLWQAFPDLSFEIIQFC